MCSYEPHKNIAVSSGTTVKEPEFLIPLRDAQNVCAIAKVGTVLKVLSCIIFNFARVQFLRMKCQALNSKVWQSLKIMHSKH